VNGSAAGAATRAVSEVLVYVGKDERLVSSVLPPPPGGIALERRGGASLALIWIAAVRCCWVPYGNGSSSKENGTSSGLQFREQIPEWQAGVLLTKEAVWLVHVQRAAVLQVVRDAGCSEGVTADLRLNPGVASSPLDHLVAIPGPWTPGSPSAPRPPAPAPPPPGSCPSTGARRLPRTGGRGAWWSEGHW